MTSRPPRPLARSYRSLTVVVAALALVTLVAGCGDKKKDKVASQTAAKVNKEEITVLQINQVLAQQRAASPEQAASAGGQALERLIDQEVALQKATDQKLDRDPRVMLQIEAARREIIARAYLEKIGEGVTKPTADEVKAYYEKNPALFANRRIYNMQEVDIDVPAAQVETLRTALAGAKTFSAFIDYLKANNIKFQGSEGVRAAEQLPLTSVEQFAALKDGQAVFAAGPKGARVVHLVGSRSQPVDLQAATVAIQQYLINERKRKMIADDIRALRAAAKVEYVGDYAANKPAPAPAPAPEEKPKTSVLADLPPPVNAASQVDIAPRDTAPASMPSGATLDKGLKGMK
ncbi:MAG: EpsD family peptidyl-prolyl cis-trans isomerase [Burkholderiales bacterium]|nr:EpsD family peptidyl-prolyl cis-trans isomerase [Burkholderiales bacterium]